MDEKVLIFKVAWILGHSENSVKYDLPLVRIIEKLVKRHEELAEQCGVNLYES